MSTIYWKDVVPWSLIYGEQNKKHTAEIEQLQRSLDIERQKNLHLSLHILEDILCCSTHDFNNTDKTSCVWRHWSAIMYNITPRDVRSLAQLLITSTQGNLGFIADEINARCEILCELLNAIS